MFNFPTSITPQETFSFKWAGSLVWPAASNSSFSSFQCTTGRRNYCVRSRHIGRLSETSFYTPVYILCGSISVIFYLFHVVGFVCWPWTRGDFQNKTCSSGIMEQLMKTALVTDFDFDYHSSTNLMRYCPCFTCTHIIALYVFIQYVHF